MFVQLVNNYKFAKYRKRFRKLVFSQIKHKKGAEIGCVDNQVF